MKKINTTKLMALLASLCLITSSFVGSTLAKYTTSGTSTDSARVAKFGVVVSATSDTMFSETYAAEDGAYAGILSVSASEKVVAPGTGGNLTTVTLSGQPEVAVRVTNAATLTLTGWEAGNYYCPIAITVGTETFNGMDYALETDPVAAFKEDVEDAIKAYTKDYEPGTNLSGETEACPVVSWAWAFEDGVGQTNEKDTILGNAGSAEIELSITTTVTQIN